MAASSLMSVGVRAMAANYAALQTTGHNIANASVEGYSRQQVELATSQGQFTGAGFFGRGVDVETVTRTHNEFITREAATARSVASMDAARLEALQQLEGVFPPGELGVGYAAGQFLNAMVDLASRPADDSTRQVVLARAAETADRFAAAGQQLDQIQLGVTAALGDAATRVNQLTGRIAAVNEKIAALQGLGQPPNDLLDERDRLIGQLSDLVQVTTVKADDGSVGVFIAGGQRLVLGNQATTLQVVPDRGDPTRSALAVNDLGQLRVLQESALGGGSLAGWLQFQNDDLLQARLQLGQMAASLAGVVNGQQALGLDLRDPPGAGAPLFATNAPQAQPASTNARTATGAYAAQVSLAVTDATQLRASEYDLRSDGAGGWALTRLSDGLVRTVADGDEVDGFTISLGAPAPASTDRFLLQPVTRAANGMERVLDDPRGLAAASPVTASVAATNLGTASVGALRMVSAPVDPTVSASITFGLAGAYNWTLQDAAGQTLVGSGNWVPGSPIAINGFEIDLNGVPASGDVINVAKTAFPRQNNTNALAFVALRESAFIGRSVQSDGTLGGGSTVTDAYASTMSGVGVRVQGARTAAEISATVSGQAEQNRASTSGVNLDEEAARLLQFQQSYQAAAKVLQIAQAVFDTLLQTAGR